MAAYTTPGDHRRKSARLLLIDEAARSGVIRPAAPAPRRGDTRMRGAPLALALPLSLLLWALVWFALTRLISNWP